MVKRRPRKSIEQWKAVIADQQASGLSRLEYCLKHDIHIDTFSARLSEINRGLNGRNIVSADTIAKPNWLKSARQVVSLNVNLLPLLLLMWKCVCHQASKRIGLHRCLKVCNHEDVC